jgi:hypothetical protein
MAVDFASPSFRASSSDLTIAISPLGLVELSDEEFEVHGPRLNRYATSWAFYLGRHWSYRRELGEPQLTFNYTRAFSDFLTSFCFGRGASFQSPDATSAIVPYLLQRVWEKDNRKDNILWELGNSGSVTGDCFCKVAYEEPYTTGVTEDPETGEMVPIPGVAQIQVPGRVRIIPLNSAFCFPEFHPHDRNRIIRFKLKYRFWGQTPEGTRQVFTYVELITDTEVSEYVNDSLIGTWPNVIGEIPIVHIRNLPISGSPWGMSDISDIMSLNREYNEKATDISDIINYHAAPVTILTGGRAQDLEKGSKKVWSIPNDKARVTNLEISPEGIEMALEYLKQVKTGMHEMTGVPEGALGQAQAISNTSGVALAIQYMPLMMRNSLKRAQYSQGIEAINRLILKTLYLKEPNSIFLDSAQDVTPRDDNLVMLDMYDQVSYENTVVFQSPLPVDKLVKLNELQLLMVMGLESKVGALTELGEEFPYEKLEELFKELVEDAERQAALNLLKAEAASMTAQQTGFAPGADGTPTPVPPAPAEGGVSSAGGSGVTGASGGGGAGVSQFGIMPGVNLTDPEDVKKMFARVVQMAHQPMQANVQKPETDKND